MVARPEAYRWSSYCATAGYETAPPWLETGWLLGQFSADRGEAQALSRAFVDEKLADRRSLRDNLVGRIYLGSVAWTERLRERIEGGPLRSDDHPRAQREIGRPGMAKVVATVATAFGTEEEQIRHRHGGAERMVAAWLGFPRPGRLDCDKTLQTAVDRCCGLLNPWVRHRRRDSDRCSFLSAGRTWI